MQQSQVFATETEQSKTSSLSDPLQAAFANCRLRQAKPDSSQQGAQDNPLEFWEEMSEPLPLSFLILWKETLNFPTV